MEYAATSGEGSRLQRERRRLNIFAKFLPTIAEFSSKLSREE